MLPGPAHVLVIIGGIMNDDQQAGWAVSDKVYAADFSVCIFDPDTPCSGWFAPGNSTSGLVFPGLCQHAMQVVDESTDAMDGNSSTVLLYGGLQPSGTVSSDIWSASIKYKSPTPTPIPTPTPTPTPKPHKPHGGGESNIVVIVCSAVAVGLVVLGVGIFVGLYYRRNARRIREFQDSLAAVGGPTGQDEGQTWGQGKQNPEDFRNVEQQFGEALVHKPDWVIDFNDLRVIKQIGHGALLATPRRAKAGRFHVCGARRLVGEHACGYQALFPAREAQA